MNMYSDLRFLLPTLIMSLLGFIQPADAQYCDSLVPSFTVDLSASANMNWVSPVIARDGNCCGTSAPDKCLEFVITLNPGAIAVNFNIASGAIPPGALFYQIDCGPPVPVGNPICLSGPGPFTLTFCKPGNNANSFSIVSYSEPIVGPDITLNAGCQGFIHANYYNEPTISWTSVAPGLQGAYDGLLSCTAGCDTTYITAPTSAPAYVDYLVCGYDIGGCNPNPICDTIRVNFIPPVDVNISSPVAGLCPGATTTLMANASGGSGAYSYVWSTGATAASITSGPGTYFVDVTDTSGCHVASDTISIAAYPSPVVDAGPNQSICEGTSVTLAGTGASAYVWNNGVTDGIPFVQPPGTVLYTVTGTDANGCSATDQVSIVMNALPVVSAGPDVIVCEGTPVTLQGSGAVSYVWDNGISDGVSFNQAVGMVTYTVIGTDGNNCASDDQVNVTVNPLPIVNAGADIVICDGAEVILNATGAQSYAWTNGITNGVPFYPSPGFYSYSVTGTDANGCQNTDQVTVTVYELPTISAGSDVEACEGSEVTLTATGGVSYSWMSGITNGVPFTPGVGTQTYIVTGIGENGCQNQDQVTVTINPLPDVFAGADQELCEGQMVTLSATGTGSLSWTNGVINQIPFNQPAGTFEYIVNALSADGCSSADTLIVTIFPGPDVTAPNFEICEGESVTLSGQGAYTYEWTFGVLDGVPFTPLSTSTYTVIGTDTNGCTGVATSTVVVNQPPNVDFKILDPSLTTLESITSFDNLTTGASSYFWEFGDGSPGTSEFEPTHTFPTEQSGEYEIILTAWSPQGCPAEKVKYIHVFPEFTIYVPNAFTPDYNGVNEVFKPVMDGFNENDYVMYIFDRWGEIVFETHNMEVGWDGSYASGEYAAQDAVYVWKIIAGLKESGDTKIFVGHVTLLK